MRKIILLLLFCFSLFISQAQSTFTSIKQAKYIRAEDNLQYIGGSYDNVEIAFHTREGYILLKNKDTNVENRFINIIPAKKPNTWRAYSNLTKKSYLLSFVTSNNEMCVVIDDNSLVMFFMVHTAKDHK